MPINATQAIAADVKPVASPKPKFWRSPYFRFGGSAVILTLLLTFLPYRQVFATMVGGDLVRAGMAFLFSRSRAAIVLGSLMDRVQDVGGLLGVTAIGILMLPGTLDYHTHKLFWTLAGLLVLGG